jgi:catechol-2,3-dioxygenase
VLYVVGDTLLFFTPLEKAEPRAYEKENIGLNHLAFGVRSVEELKEVAAQLNTAGIAHSGIQMCRFGEVEFIWLDDPDRIRVEFYRRPA